MAGCTCENWTVQDLAFALEAKREGNKKIVVPLFQRGKRWNKEQEQEFIDSLIRGYPVGTMLFYERLEDGKRTYILVDGLQRSNSIKRYITNPTDFFYNNDVPDDFCSEILKTVCKNDDRKLYEKIRILLTDFIKNQKTYRNVQYYSVAKRISEVLSVGYESVEDIIEVIKQFFEEKQELYDKITNTVIPVIVYTGDEDNLPEIFDRINSKGTPLDQYEVYAAAWPVKRKFQIENKRIIEYVIRKYDMFEEDGFEIHEYNRETMRTEKNVNAFEYLFGLSKYLVERYGILAFNRKFAEDTVNPLAFELVNACLNDSDKIKTLYLNLYNIDVNNFEKALIDAIEFVCNSILVITKFKGNSRNTNKIFHSKYQILSMISTTFKEMYAGTDFTHTSSTWLEYKDRIARNLVQYYVYDIITNYWSEGGVAKMYSAAKSNRYAIELSNRTWMVALDSFFEKSMLRSEKKSAANPRSEEYVILNCIYLNTFTAMDQLSIARFDVEHIVPKEQMRKLIAGCEGEGLPISCVANLCYLPEYVNRSKKANTFYQDKKYLQHIDLSNVESKYSFTTKADLEWMNKPYKNPDDFQILKKNYTDFCTKRFEKIKRLFCDALGIRYEEISIEENYDIIRMTNLPSEHREPESETFADKCVHQLEKKEHFELIQVGRNTFTTADNKKGFVISISKVYKQGARKKYWFVYRRSSVEKIKKCEEKYVLYGCKDENTIVCLPIEEIEKRLDRLNFSAKDDTISHWHIVFFKGTDGKMTWMLSKPEVEEVKIDKYLI